VSRFVLFCSLDLYTIGRTPWTSDRPIARPLPKYRTAQTQNKRTYTHTHTHTPNIHGRSEIRTHDHSVRAREDSSCPRPLGYRDRLMRTIRSINIYSVVKRRDFQRWGVTEVLYGSTGSTIWHFLPRFSPIPISLTVIACGKQAKWKIFCSWLVKKTLPTFTSKYNLFSSCTWH
jgi:hypothetical protein